MRALEPSMYLEKPLPSSADAERIILGAIFLDNDLISQAAEFLLPGDFYHPKHRAVYAAMVSLFRRSETIDPVLVGEALKKNGQPPESFGGVAAIVNLTYGLPHFSDIRAYVETVRRKSIARKLIKTCAEIQSAALGEAEEVEDVLDFAEGKICNLREGSRADAPEAIGELIFASYRESLERARDQKTALGLKTNFADLDRLTAGLQKTDLIVIAARPSMGKSSLALDIVKGATDADREVVCAVFSLEMSKRQCADRLLCSIAEINSNDYRLGDLPKEKWERAARAAADLQNRQIIIDDKAAISVMEVKAKARQIAAGKKRLDLIVIDYLQLMRGSKNTESRQQEVSEISRDLKSLAKDLRVPVIALSQLSRACETRTDKRPLMSDLRESGSIEQDADIVAFIYRDEYYHQHGDNAGVAELIFRKHRHGATGTIKLAFIKQFAKFGNFYPG